MKLVFAYGTRPTYDPARLKSLCSADDTFTLADGQFGDPRRDARELSKDKYTVDVVSKQETVRWSTLTSLFD